MAYGEGKKKMMPYMDAYNKGYKPAQGSAGGEARGKFTTSKNPRPVPLKGSQITASQFYGTNSDRQKVMSLEKAQQKRESLRGQGC